MPTRTGPAQSSTTSRASVVARIDQLYRVRRVEDEDTFPCFKAPRYRHDAVGRSAAARGQGDRADQQKAQNVAVPHSGLVGIDATYPAIVSFEERP